jgi:hypothetical protein
METSVAASGTMKRIQVQEKLTFVGVPTAEKGVIHGIGKGVVMATGGESDMITYTGEGIRRLDSSIYVTLILVRHIDGYPFPIYVKLAVVTIFRQFPLLSNRHNTAIW